jgi:hypothetical protein
VERQEGERAAYESVRAEVKGKRERERRREEAKSNNRDTKGIGSERKKRLDCTQD